MRVCFIALILCTWFSALNAQVLAQEASPLAPVPPPRLNQPMPAANPGETAPNPFRNLNAPILAPESEFGEPGFAEATDQERVNSSVQGNRSSVTSSPRSRPPVPTPVSTRNSSGNQNTFSPRLARAAPIMGDSLSPMLQFTDPYDYTIAQIPTGGGATRRKIGENTGAMPMDRIIFNYNNFQNAVDSLGESTNIDRYTLGIEKTFLSSLFSVDVRLPLSANNDVSDPGYFSRNGSELGNVSVALKMLLTSDDQSAFVAGLVVDTPTGGGTTASLPSGASLKYNNDAVHLAPFLGMLFVQDAGVTHQGFIQVDVPTNPNGFTYIDPTVVSAEFEEQTLLYVDYSVSKSIYEGGKSRRGQRSVQRVSALAEFHYTTTLEESDTIAINTSNSLFDLTSEGNRIDVLNMTMGIDTLLSCGANLRFATVVPLTDGDDRFFDVEFLAQLNFAL